MNGVSNDPFLTERIHTYNNLVYAKNRRLTVKRSHIKDRLNKIILASTKCL